MNDGMPCACCGAVTGANNDRGACPTCARYVAALQARAEAAAAFIRHAQAEGPAGHCPGCDMPHCDLWAAALTAAPSVAPGVSDRAAGIVAAVEAYFVAHDAFAAMEDDYWRHEHGKTFDRPLAYPEAQLDSGVWWEEWHRRHDAAEETEAALRAAVAGQGED